MKAIEGLFHNKTAAVVCYLEYYEVGLSER